MTETTTQQLVISYAKDGKPAREIAELVGCAVATVYHYTSKARRAGHAIPRLMKGRPRGGPYSTIGLTAKTSSALRPQAEARGLTVQELSLALLNVIARENLATAILDDEGQPDA